MYKNIIFQATVELTVKTSIINTVMNDNNIAVLVVSCDKYSDMWPIFFELKKRKWSDCPYRTYLGSNFKKSELDGVTDILIGEDKSWSDNVRNMLSSIEEDYIIMLLDDFFIDRELDTDRIRLLAQYLEDKNIDCLRMEPEPGPARVINRKLKVGLTKPGYPFYVSTQPAIWKKSSLAGLLKEGYSAWDFELRNSENADNLNMVFAGTKNYVFHHINGVDRGKYYSSTVEFLNKEGIKADFEKRGVLANKTLSGRIDLKMYRFKTRVKCLLAEFGLWHC